MLVSTSIILSLDSVRAALSDPQFNMTPIYLLLALGSAFPANSHFTKTPTCLRYFNHFLKLIGDRKNELHLKKE